MNTTVNGLKEIAKVNTGVSTKVESLELTDESIANFGLDVQKSVGELTDEITNSVKTKNAGKVGESITALMNVINKNDTSNKGKGIISRILHKVPGGNSLYNIQARNQSVSRSVDSIEADLKASQIQLSDDNKIIDKMYNDNASQFRQLNALAIEAHNKLEELENTIIPELKDKLKTLDPNTDAEEYNESYLKLNEYQSMQTALNRKFNSLVASRQSVLIRAPKLRMIKETNLTTISNLQDSINFAIPIWRQQSADAIIMERQQQAIKIQEFMTKQTNDMITEGANTVKKSTIEAQKQSDKAFISAASLSQATDILKDTLLEVHKLQEQSNSLRKQEAQDLLESGDKMKSVALSLMNDDQLKIED